MEKFLKNKTLAVIIMLAAMLCSMLLGGHRSLTRLRSGAEEVFLSGVNGDGIGIQSDLEKVSAAAYNLTVVGKRFETPAEQEIFAVETRREEWKSAETVEEKAEAGQALIEASQALYDSMDASALGQQDREYWEEAYAVIEGRERTIGRDGYNQKAEEFNSVLSSFPASFFGKLTFVKPLPVF